MALHWKHLKAFYGTTAARTLDTYIEFKEKPSTGNYIYDLENYLPEVWINDHGATNQNDCGHIVTNHVDTTFYNDLSFVNGEYSNLNLGRGSYLAFVEEGGSGPTDSYAYFYNNDNGTYYSSITGFHFLISGGTRTGYIDFISTTAPYAYFGNTGSSMEVRVFGDLKADYIRSLGSCEAVYFNATSDIRAKDNLQPIPTNMLDIVKEMEVYTFNYKINPEDMSLGLIAQDLQNININGFSLVDNLNATGENDDYMSIHESKLVYILIEAVKELSAKVESLERELHGSK